jgi:cytochrome d ubiquinol oxidase subunit I
MDISLGFHIIYASFGIGLPFMLMITEWLSLRTEDELYHQLGRRSIRPAGLLFAIGTVSGIILSFELGLLNLLMRPASAEEGTETTQGDRHVDS